MPTPHPDALEFLQWYAPRVLITSARCPLCRRWTYVDLLAGELVCARHPTPQRWTLRELIDRAAQRTMETPPRGATPYHKPRKR